MDSGNNILISIPWSTEVKTITALVLLVLGVTVFFVLRGNLQVYVKALICAFILITSLWCACLAPRHLNVGNENLTIKKVCGKITVPLVDIMDISLVDSKIVSGSIRTFGSGGFFGYLGKFHNSDIGSFSMYATERKNLILITTKEKRYVVNCSEPEKIVNFVKSSI